MDSKFAAAFRRLSESGADLFELRGSSIIVEVLPEDEIKTKSGLILAAKPEQLHGSVLQHKALIGLVLAVGAGYYDDETKEDIPLEVQPGDIVLLPQFAITPLSTFPGLDSVTNNRLGIIKDESIIFRYKGKDALEKARDLLNAEPTDV